MCPIPFLLRVWFNILFSGCSPKYCKAEQYVSFTYNFAFSSTAILEPWFWKECNYFDHIFAVAEVLLRGWEAEVSALLKYYLEIDLSRPAPLSLAYHQVTDLCPLDMLVAVIQLISCWAACLRILETYTAWYWFYLWACHSFVPASDVYHLCFPYPSSIISKSFMIFIAVIIVVH